MPVLTPGPFQEPLETFREPISRSEPNRGSSLRNVRKVMANVALAECACDRDLGTASEMAHNFIRHLQNGRSLPRSHVIPARKIALFGDKAPSRVHHIIDEYKVSALLSV